MSRSKRLYILYDGRAILGSTDAATVLVSCNSNHEATSYRGTYGDMACYSYKLTKDAELVDERFERSWTGGKPC